MAILERLTTPPKHWLRIFTAGAAFEIVRSRLYRANLRLVLLSPDECDGRQPPLAMKMCGLERERLELHHPMA